MTDQPNRRRAPEDRYERMLLLDRLEELREDMDELGITSRDQLEARIRQLHAELDEADDVMGDGC